MIGDAEITLALAYAPATKRPGLTALFALDARLGGIVRGTSEALIGEMRLTWWHDAIKALGDARAPDEPLLRMLQERLAGADFAMLAGMVEGWSQLLAPMPLDEPALRSYAAGRGGLLFEQAALMLGEPASDVMAAAGGGWALVDFGFRCSDRGTAALALALAGGMLGPALARRWPSSARPLGILAHLALRDVRAGLDRRRAQGSPGRLLRAMRHRMTGL